MTLILLALVLQLLGVRGGYVPWQPQQPTTAKRKAGQ